MPANEVAPQGVARIVRGISDPNSNVARRPVSSVVCSVLLADSQNRAEPGSQRPSKVWIDRSVNVEAITDGPADVNNLDDKGFVVFF